MKRISINFLILLSIIAGFLVVHAIADQVVVKSGGKYFLLKKDSSGNPVNVPVRVFVDLDNGTTNPTDPIPTPTNELGKKIKELTEITIKNGGTATTAAGISSVYSLAANKIDSFRSLEDSLKLISQGVDIILRNVPDSAKWTSFRADISDALNELAQDGKLKTKADYLFAFNEIKGGINSAIGFNGSLSAPQQHIVENQGLLDKIDIEKLMKLIEFIMKLWELFAPKP